MLFEIDKPSEPASPKELRKDTPDELAAVVSRALEKDVSQRLRSSDVVAELAGSVSGESTLSGEEKAHLTRTRRGRIAAVATLVLLIGPPWLG